MSTKKRTSVYGKFSFVEKYLQPVPFFSASEFNCDSRIKLDYNRFIPFPQPNQKAIHQLN